MEKVENLCRTATAQQIFPTRRYTWDHACAIPPAGRQPIPRRSRHGGGHKYERIAAKIASCPFPEMSHFAAEF
jgi:hypothetical protein